MLSQIDIMSNVNIQVSTDVDVAGQNKTQECVFISMFQN